MCRWLTGSDVVDAAERLTIARILKVNHAGEYGAIRIYKAQLWVARRLYADVVAFLEETLAHEVRRCALFREAMPVRNARPCRIMALWGNGGYVLGFLTALIGRQGIWVCTAAVESAVHRHLQTSCTSCATATPSCAPLWGRSRRRSSPTCITPRSALPPEAYGPARSVPSFPGAPTLPSGSRRGAIRRGWRGSWRRCDRRGAHLGSTQQPGSGRQGTRAVPPPKAPRTVVAGG